MPDVRALKERIERREYTVGVIGLGYVGLPLVLRFGEVGFRVVGFDVDPAKVKQLGEGSSYIQHIPTERVSALARSGLFQATADLGRLNEPDALIICVPTPLTRQREPDLQYVERTADAIARTLRPGQLVCLESTTYPGTTEEVLLPRFTARGLGVGEHFFLAFSPEREDPANAHFTTATIPKVLGGVTPACLELAGALYAQVVDKVVPVSSTRVAEAAKILENVYRAVNIALVNELKVAFDRMGVDIWEVIDAAKTKPFGFQAFYPGPGLGGHCIPIDPFYLTWKAREYGVATRFIELAGEINSAMPAYVVQRLVDALNARGKPLHGARVLVLGVAYKRDTGDARESPGIKILDLLLAKGAQAEYSDPYFPRLPRGRHSTLAMDSAELSAESLGRYDAVLLVTDHSAFPYALIHEASSLIVDSRNAFRQRGLTGKHVVPA
ncbi:MAG: nucleotide sugar dehydrogenase [Candidatus Rokubacteria bacterium]|nr:nucleotide sugar dehydrogenase [Candidatus Rokubacteria bacterium]